MTFLHILHVCFMSSAELLTSDLSQFKTWLTKWCLEKVLTNLNMRFTVLALEHRKAISFPRTPASSFKHIN